MWCWYEGNDARVAFTWFSAQLDMNMHSTVNVHSVFFSISKSFSLHSILFIINLFNYPNIFLLWVIHLLEEFSLKLQLLSHSYLHRPGVTWKCHKNRYKFKELLVISVQKVHIQSRRIILLYSYITLLTWKCRYLMKLHVHIVFHAGFITWFGIFLSRVCGSCNT